MESKEKLKDIDIKNHTCYYFDDIMRVADIDFDNILFGKKSHNTYKNILIYDISYKTFISAKPLRIRFHEIDGFIKIYEGIRYLVLFGPGWYHAIYKWKSKSYKWKSGITDSINHYFARIRIDLCNILPIEKILTFHNVIILIKSVVNKNKNKY